MVARTPGLVAHVIGLQSRERPVRRIGSLNHWYDGYRRVWFATLSHPEDDLTWSGATSSNVDIYRDGTRIVVTHALPEQIVRLIIQFAVHNARRRCIRMRLDFLCAENVEHFYTA